MCDTYMATCIIILVAIAMLVIIMPKSVYVTHICVTYMYCIEKL